MDAFVQIEEFLLLLSGFLLLENLDFLSFESESAFKTFDLLLFFLELGLLNFHLRQKILILIDQVFGEVSLNISSVGKGVNQLLFLFILNFLVRCSPLKLIDLLIQLFDNFIFILKVLLKLRLRPQAIMK